MRLRLTLPAVAGGLHRSRSDAEASVPLPGTAEDQRSPKKWEWGITINTLHIYIQMGNPQKIVYKMGNGEVFCTKKLDWMGLEHVKHPQRIPKSWCESLYKLSVSHSTIGRTVLLFVPSKKDEYGH